MSVCARYKKQGISYNRNGQKLTSNLNVLWFRYTCEVYELSYYNHESETAMANHAPQPCFLIHVSWRMHTQRLEKFSSLKLQDTGMFIGNFEILFLSNTCRALVCLPGLGHESTGWILFLLHLRVWLVELTSSMNTSFSDCSQPRKHQKETRHIIKGD
jgi:hypothetical protein